MMTFVLLHDDTSKGELGRWDGGSPSLGPQLLVGKTDDVVLSRSMFAPLGAGGPEWDYLRVSKCGRT